MESGQLASVFRWSAAAALPAWECRQYLLREDRLYRRSRNSDLYKAGADLPLSGASGCGNIGKLEEELFVSCNAVFDSGLFGISKWNFLK